MLFRFCASSVVLGILLGACTGSDPAVASSSTPDLDGGSGSDGGDSTAPAIQLADVAPIALRRGESLTVRIAITRSAGFKAPVKIEMQPVPAGLAAAPLTIGPEATTGDLEITSVDSAAQTRTTVQILASADGVPSVSKQAKLLVRGLPGERDTTYGEKDGATSVSTFFTYRMVRAKDGSLYLLGAYLDNQIAHVLPDGRIDAAFGTGGVVTLKPKGVDFQRLAIRSDGNVIIGSRDESPRTTLFVHALDPKGNYIDSFGVEGVQTVPISDGFIGFGLDSTDGVIAGAFASSRMTLARVTAAGAVDTAFGGQNLSALGGAWYELLVDPAGNTIATGTVSDGDTSTVAVARITSTDVTPQPLATTGKLIDAWSSTLDAKGRIVVAGALVDTDFKRAAFVTRALATGLPDATFGDGGELREHLADDDVPSFFTVLAEPSGNLICVGDNALGTNGNFEAILVRYTEDGTRDLGFGHQGMVIDVDAGGTSSGGAVLDGDDGILVARSFAPKSTVILRYWR